MEILFLGTGGCIPSIKKPLRSFAGFYIDLGTDSLLFDIGPGTLVKMQQSGININENPAYLFITHLHPDHSADFIGLMQGRGLRHIWYKSENKIRVYGGKGIREFTNQIFNGVTAWLSFSQELKASNTLIVEEVEGGIIVQEKNFQVSAVPVQHFNSLAYKLTINEKTIAYTGDMGYDESFSSFAKEADLAIMECSFPNRETLRGTHLCPEDIGALAKKGNFKKIALTHMYPECEGKEEEIIEVISKYTSAEVIIAHDLMRLKI